MSFTENGGGNDLVMPVAPMGGNGGWGNGFGGDGWWVILFLFALMGNGGWGGFGGNNGMAIWPYFTAQNTDAGVQRGFDTAALTSQLAGINTNISNGFADAQVAGCNRAMDAMQTAYNNEIASLNRSFAAQTATTQGFTDIAAQLANCCCENRLATANLGADIAREACATRTSDTQNTQSILTTLNQGIQSIKDQMCQDKIDAKNDTISQLRQELMFARNQASQDVQTAAIQAGQRVLANEIEQYVAPKAVPAYVVQNPNCCSQNTGCGCGF